ncbi:glycoside hydrolase family 99-like domain-containing protein [Selenomonas sp. AB3002]|uniref:glycosyltransferase WbsX family protein n=1 Tax=Selenomonas sp. AB3002 TaxID=1392502 RepID=UPI00068E7224
MDKNDEIKNINQSSPRVIAMYLPQFHRVRENDDWWGEGYTEWTAVKKACPMFNGHSQPKIPLNSNYYDLMEKDVMVWQAYLARKYGVNAFCFYHYWFKDGRRILERPAENLLKWKDIDMPFCFCWANETWARTWEVMNVEVNSWTSKNNKIFDNEILLMQNYGTRGVWEKHIEYLIPFFKDSRYIKINNKPVFVLYYPHNIHCLVDMMEVWNEVLKREGFDGVYLIGDIKESMPVIDINDINSWMIRYPIAAKHKIKKHVEDVATLDYDEMWDSILSYDDIQGMNKPCYCCACVNYDDTPRHGDLGTVCINFNDEKFYRYFRKLYGYCKYKKLDFIFLNAWNEWGEGMYLEPDEQNGFGLLEAVRRTVYNDEIEDNPGINNGRISENSGTDGRYYLDMKKQGLVINALSQWLRINEKGEEVRSFFYRNKYRRIAIYGGGRLGKHLIANLVGSDVEIKYIIDKNKSLKICSYPTFTLEDKLPPVDAVVITPIGMYEALRSELRKYVDYDTVSLEYILYEFC